MLTSCVIVLPLRYDVSAMGRTAARVASAVISKHGAVLGMDDAEALADVLAVNGDRTFLASIDAALSSPLCAGLESIVAAESV